ncbi:MAG TPA: hypothetical protein VLH08_07675 [Acidobacteriota bacterium]|nr:hypothetical protein [Acidobacteriota bacterium]
MSVRIQVIVEENEALEFKTQARKEGKSTSAWLRDAGKKEIESKRPQKSLKSTTALKTYFDKINAAKDGKEPEWDEHKKLISEGYRSGLVP